MAGLLDGVLPYLYSQGDRAKRRINGLLGDPLGSIEQTAGLLSDRRREHNATMAKAFADPSRPLQVTDQNALGLLIDNTMAGPMGFAPVGMLNAGPADQIAEILSALKSVPLKERAGLRLLPGDVPSPNVGDALRPSSKWIDGVQTDRQLKGTAAMDLAGRTPADVAEAIRRLGLYNSPGQGYYPGNKLAVISGPGKVKGEDHGEAVIRDAIVRFITDPPLGAR